ncbi:MAG: retropepsin-like aspartic protease [bacterium]|nr:retropepsin-like aspartic protease [bacterium]
MNQRKWEPFIPVILISPETTLKRYFLVDSGADMTLFPKGVGEKLGFKIREGEEIKSISGVSGSLPVVHRRIKLRIGEFEFDAPVAWALEEEVPLLLGREVVFDKFDIEFRQAERKIIFKWRG